MSRIYTTEITSDEITSDRPLHQRLLKPYVVAHQWVRGNLLEVGCGEGRGIKLLLPYISSYAAIDKIATAIEKLKVQFPQGDFISGSLPPLPYKDATFDSVVSFQVIEHIDKDKAFLEEIHRVLKPGGVALLTTPNRLQSLSRNPWHVREYTVRELKTLAQSVFRQVEMKTVGGNKKVMAYHERNRASVNRIMRWDFLDLQHRLPASWLRIPYDLLNRKNRKGLESGNDSLVASISHEDYLIGGEDDGALDLFLIAVK